MDPTIKPEECLINKYHGILDPSTLRVFDNHGEYYSRAFVAYEKSKHKIGVAFRGTVSTSGKNWSVNIDTAKVKLDGEYEACSNDPVLKGVKPLTA